MVGIASDVAGGSALYFARSVREAVPDGFAFAIFAPGAFNLIGGGGGAPDKFVGKLEGRELRLRFEQFADEAMTGRHDCKRGGRTKSSGEKFTATQAGPTCHGLP